MRGPGTRVGSVVALVLCVCGVFFYLTHHSHTVTITRTEQGFIPKTVLIHKGDIVQFISTAGAAFWPASELYSSQSLSFVFDPGHALLPTEIWSHTFEQAGVWNFHDRIVPEMRGSILVEGAKDESIKNCLSASHDITRGYCWAAEITATMKQSGLSAGFDAVSQYYQTSPEFQNQCHDVMHVLGSTAYSEYKKTGVHIARPETSYCGYGFYHGFMEQMLIELGRDYLHEANSYCIGLLTDPVLPSRAAGSSAAAACFHGIGHALFDSLPGASWGNEKTMAMQAIGECETVTTNTQWRARCASGVFNSLSIAEGSNDYNLSYRASDPAALCRTQTPAYRQSCYSELAMGYIHYVGYDYTHAIYFINQLPGNARYSGLMALFDDTVRHNLQDKTLEQLYEETIAFPEEKEREAVIDGVANALSSGGKPGAEYLQMLAYCSLFPISDARTHCYRRTIDTLSALYSNTALSAICKTIPVGDQAVCTSSLRTKNL
ncbi:MAG: hypothetical protein WCK46_00270 [Candidatus Adlerbacteria bacterium]